MMKIIATSTGEQYLIEVIPLEITDYKAITKGRYFFNWKSEKGKEVFKLRIIETNEFLGLISIERIPEEWRIHIRLLTVSIENMGKHQILFVLNYYGSMVVFIWIRIMNYFNL